MIQMEKKITVKIMNAVEMNTPRFQRGPSSFQTLMKKISWTKDWMRASVKMVAMTVGVSRLKYWGLTIRK
jgi:hypothetical protein